MAGTFEKDAVRYLRFEVEAYSRFYRQYLPQALTGGKLRSLDDLTRVRPVSLAEAAADPAALVLRPKQARRRGRKGERVDEEIEYRYKPVHWILQGGVPIGSSAADLDRLTQLGARWLLGCGMEDGDVLVGFVPPGPNLPFWELVLGARHLGVPALHLPAVPTAEDIAHFRPTVLAGRPFDLCRLLESGRGATGDRLNDVRIVIAVGEPLDRGLRTRLEAMVGADAVVVSAWAPPGVRTLWWECTPDSGLHTWPEAELVQMTDPLSGTPVPAGADGEVVWTALGWQGTVLVRLRTGVFAAMETGICPECGAPGPRLRPMSTAPSFLDALDRNTGVAGWQAELRMADGREELLVFLVPARGARLERLLAELDTELFATQYVVLDRARLDARLAAHDDQRVLDLRH